MNSRLYLLVFLLILFAPLVWSGQPTIRRVERPHFPTHWGDLIQNCGKEGNACCPPYEGSPGGIIGPTHCDAGLGCNVTTNICEQPCGHPGEVCCDGTDTVAAQGGRYILGDNGVLQKRKPMCEASSCDGTTRHCINDCGNNAGDKCCAGGPDHYAARCTNPALACEYTDASSQKGVCQICGGLGQIPCPGHRCTEDLEEKNGHCAKINPDDYVFGPHSYGQRAWCFDKNDPSSLSGRYKISGSMLESKLPLSSICIESGHKGNDGSIQVSVDNPRIWDGASVLGTNRTSLGVSFQESDHLTNIIDGDGSASNSGFFALDTSGSAASVNASLPRIPTATGDFGTSGQEQINLITPGIRIGHRPVTVSLQDVQSNPTPMRPNTDFRMALKPDVLLVPVQVFALYSDQFPNVGDNFTRELALKVFDRAADLGVGKSRITDGNGNVLKVTWPLPNIVLDGDYRAASANSHKLPDDIWAQCGVQFRLVNYTRLHVPNIIAAPPQGTHTLYSSTVIDQMNEVRKNPAFIDRTLTIITAPRCSDINQNPGFGQEVLGQAVLGEYAACIQYSAGGTTLAHEIGHIIMGNDRHIGDETDSNNLMLDANGGEHLTPDQCEAARKILLDKEAPYRLRFPAPR